MARQYNVNFKDEAPVISTQESWIRGLNTLVSATQIKPNELSEAVDIQLIEDGKIQCPRDGQSYYGSSNGSRNHGLFSYYLSNGTKKLVRAISTKLQVYNAGTWDDISGYTYTASKNAEAVTAYDKLYVVNGTDPLTYYDGSTITSFTAISAPTTPTVTRTGTTGTYTYSYKITAVTAVGETTPSSAGTQVANVATLDNTTYMTVTWSAVTNAIGYNVYGRKDGSWYFMAYIEGNGSLSYADKGQDTPYELAIPPTENTTNGPVGKDIELYKDTLFIIGDPANPSRLYYSAGGDKINDFSAANGGGSIDISKNDGEQGIALKPFKNTMLVFKEGSIYQFSFSSTGAPQVSQVTGSIGAVSTRGVVTVENDIFFASRRGIFTIGNEAGFAFDVLRTNELSAKIRSVYQTIDTAYIQNISAVYATTANTNLVIFSYTPTGSTTNSKAIVYDRERLGFVEWTNIQANCWTNFIDSTGETHILYGDDSSGYVKEILSGSNDFGTAIEGSFALSAEAFKDITRYKRIKDLTVVLRNPSGSANLSIVSDGTTTSFMANVNTVSPTINFGHYVFNRFLFGSSYGSGAVTSQDDFIERTRRNINAEGRNFQVKMNNGSSGASFVLLNCTMSAKQRSLRYRKSTDLIS